MMQLKRIQIIKIKICILIYELIRISHKNSSIYVITFLSIRIRQHNDRDRFFIVFLSSQKKKSPMQIFSINSQLLILYYIYAIIY